MASLELRVRHNFDRGSLAFRALAREHMPFVRAVTLTRIAQAARDAHRASLPRRFTIRNRRVLTSTVAVPARKADYPREASAVAVRDAWLAQHEKGGDKLPAPGRQFVAVKARQLPRGVSGRVPKSLKPGALLSRKGGAFYVDQRGYLTARGPRARGPGRRRRAHGPPTRDQAIAEQLAERLRVFYYLKRRTRLKPRLGLEDTAREIVRTRAARLGERELARATREIRHRYLRLP